MHPSILAHFSTPSLRLADGASLLRCVDYISEAISTGLASRNSRGNTEWSRVQERGTPLLVPRTSSTGDVGCLFLEDKERRTGYSQPQDPCSDGGKSTGAGPPGQGGSTASADATTTGAPNVSHDDTNIATCAPPRAIEQADSHQTSSEDMLPSGGVLSPNGPTHDKDADNNERGHCYDVLEPIRVQTLSRSRPTSAPASSPCRIRPLLGLSPGNEMPPSHKERFVRPTSAPGLLQGRHPSQYILRDMYLNNGRSSHITVGRRWEDELAPAKTCRSVEDSEKRDAGTNVGNNKIEQGNAQDDEAIERGEIGALSPTMAIPISVCGEMAQLAETKMVIEHSRDFRRVAVQLKVSTAREAPFIFILYEAQRFLGSDGAECVFNLGRA